MRPGKERGGEDPEYIRPVQSMTEDRRRLYGHYDRLMEELRVEDPRSFFNYLRMEPAVFNELVQRVMEPRIEKHDTKMREIVSRMRSECVDSCKDI